MTRLIPLALLVVIAALGKTTAEGAGVPTLSVSVGSDHLISITSVDGEPRSRLFSGTYLVIVHDRTSTDNLHLVGSRVDRRTSVPFRGVARWRITFATGQVYRFYSEAHPTDAVRLRAEFCTCTL